MDHMGDLRPSTLLYHLTEYLIYKKFRQTGEEPKLHLFGQFKRVAREWLETCLICKGGVVPAQLLYSEMLDLACNRIVAAITEAGMGERPVKAVLDSYNPEGSTNHVRFNTSKTDRWQTRADKCHINWVILDSDWEAEFCRVVEDHPKVISYVKNHNLGFEVPYRCGSETRQYRPDFIVHINDGQLDPLQLIIEIKGYRGENAKDKKLTMDTYWVPGVNHLGTHGRWAFAEFCDVYEIQSNFKEKVESEFAKLVATAVILAPSGVVPS